ncbi:MAG: DEAD/DEAH box helicase [Pseudanabaenaceae cyanobacterium SKYGB_i_bin29]|nr:DEAD/DEAH box helicase [Pseudanabaenaceae cyanobacterium SKYG29]MDW8421399.1 DEAD/DEAH box helicase [Pseudanabaenaceae cyanobacterium SKYGB_i_bin29]
MVAIVSTLDLSQLFPFTLDRFQLEAIAHLNANRSVVVCAPTGSGKTLIGEYAIHRAIAQGKRVFYTTPLKALSNQKLRDFRQIFGKDKVGLLTGDITLQREAPVLVMTTEIFRNMLYGTPIGEVGVSLTDVQTVVLDECHYMNDRQRGTVWEESIIYCPREIQLVALSATVANSEQLTDWINLVHGETALVYSDFRPVPLQYYFCMSKGMFPLLDEEQKEINPRLKAHYRHKPGKKPPEPPSLPFVVGQLKDREMLPAIYFIFSRRGCDQALEQMTSISLVEGEEAKELKYQIDRFLAQNPELGYSNQISALYRGIAAHHAGILPLWKTFIEELFQQGLIKIVFATETLAAGINMPARTTIISSLSKRTDEGHRLLTPSEFLQMAGRAGRRGMDTIGYVVTLQTPYEGLREAGYLATSEADPLVSQFTPSYGMVLNLLQTHSLERAKELIERSFGQYLANLSLEPKRQQLQELTEDIDRTEQLVTEVDTSQLAEYDKLKERLKEEKRLLKILIAQAEEVYHQDLVTYLPYALSGSLVTIKLPNSQRLPGVLAQKVQGSGQFPWFICFGNDNNWYVLTHKDIVTVGDIWQPEELVPPTALTIRPGATCKGTEETSALARSIPPLPEIPLPPEVSEQQRLVESLIDKIEQHPVNSWADKGNIIKKIRKLEQLKEKREALQQEVTREGQFHWQEFLSLVEILQHFNCLEGLQPTDRGKIAASLRGENELWLALVLDSGELDELAPHHLAAVCASLVTDNNRSDTWARLGVSMPVEEALTGLRGLRRKLLQMQRKLQVSIPVLLEFELVGLVEAWALGAKWQDLCQQTSLDEGDLVRLIRRTLDLLCQIPYISLLSESLRRNAERAAMLIDRFPVQDLI